MDAAEENYVRARNESTSISNACEKIPARFAAQVGFVNDNVAFEQTFQWVLRHGMTDTMAQMPRGPI